MDAGVGKPVSTVYSKRKDEGKREGKKLGRKKESYTKTGILIRNRDEIIGLIESRMPVRRICELYGVSRDTFARFRKEFIVRHSGDGTGLPRP